MDNKSNKFFMSEQFYDNAEKILNNEEVSISNNMNIPSNNSEIVVIKEEKNKENVEEVKPVETSVTSFINRNLGRESVEVTTNNTLTPFDDMVKVSIPDVIPQSIPIYVDPLLATKTLKTEENDEIKIKNDEVVEVELSKDLEDFLPKKEEVVYQPPSSYRATRKAENKNITLENEKLEKKEEVIDESDDSINNNKVQDWINKILRIDKEALNNVKVSTEEELFVDKTDYDSDIKGIEPIYSTKLEEIKKDAEENGKISVLSKYGDDFGSHEFYTNPSIGRSNEIRQLILILLTPEKSAILVGKPGIGKTSIVEGLAYQLQRNNVPEALKGYTIINIKTISLLGSLPNGETRLQTLVDELKNKEKIILFIDEIHMLIGATNDSAMDFANMFKEGLGRGKIKVIGATTSEEYERYILRDKAFVRRFQRVEVKEPNREHTIKILVGTLPKLERETGVKLKYTVIEQSKIMGFIVDITSEYKRVYGIGSRYPDICITLLSQAFSQAVFQNKKELTILDIRNAIINSKNIYQDVIKKEIPIFDDMFKELIMQESANI